jgi:hypothetical protein
MDRQTHVTAQCVSSRQPHALSSPVCGLPQATQHHTVSHFLLCQIRRKKWPEGGWVCAAGHINSDVYRSYCLKWRSAQPLSVMVQPAGNCQKCVASIGLVTELLTSVTIRRVYWYVTDVSGKGEHCFHLEG